MTEKDTYNVYGASPTLSGNAFRFAGMRLDPESGLYYARARYYSPTIGRFLQNDPIGYRGGINLYAYVNNDPLNHSDPTGLSSDLAVNGGGTGGGMPLQQNAAWDRIPPL